MCLNTLDDFAMKQAHLDQIYYLQTAFKIRIVKYYSEIHKPKSHLILTIFDFFSGNLLSSLLQANFKL